MGKDKERGRKREKGEQTGNEYSLCHSSCCKLGMSEIGVKGRAK